VNSFLIGIPVEGHGSLSSQSSIVVQATGVAKIDGLRRRYIRGEKNILQNEIEDRSSPIVQDWVV
jgi:ribosomal protein S12